MAEKFNVNIFHKKFSLIMLEAFVLPQQTARIGNPQVGWLRWESTCAWLGPGAEGLLGGGREWVRMKKQMLSRLEFSFILFGHLWKPYDNVFAAESLVIRSAVTDATPGFP